MDIDLSDERESTPLGKAVVEEYMPPKMRKKLRSRLLEDLRTNPRMESPVVVIDGDGAPVPDSTQTTPNPPPSASPSTSFAKLSLVTPVPIPADPISLLFSPPTQAESPSPCPTPSPLKNVSSRIPVSDVRDEPPPPPLPPAVMKEKERERERERERTGTPTTPTKSKFTKAKASPPTKVANKPEPAKPPPKKPAAKATTRGRSRKVIESEESSEEEGQIETQDEDEARMEVDGNVEIQVRGASPVPDTPASPSPPPASPSDKPSTAGSTPPPLPPPKAVRMKVTSKAKASSSKSQLAVAPAAKAAPAKGKKKKESTRPMPRVRLVSKKMDVPSLVSSEASTPNIEEKKVLPPENEKEDGEMDSEVQDPGATVEDRDVEMGEVVEHVERPEKEEEPRLPEEKAKSSPAPQETQPESVREPTPQEKEKSPTPPPPKAPTPPPPPPAKVKLSLKDFAARRKKQKEEEKLNPPPTRPTDSPVTPSTALGPSFAGGLSSTLATTMNGGAGMTKEVKLEQIQDIMMRAETPTTSGDEFGVPGLTMSPKTKAALAANKTRSASISSIVNQGPTRSPPFKSIMDTKSPSMSSAAPPPSVAAMAKALFYAPVTPTTSVPPTHNASMSSGFTGKAEVNPTAPTPTSPKVPRSIPQGATSISSVLRPPSPPSVSPSMPFSNVRAGSNPLKPLPSSSSITQRSPVIPSHSPALALNKRPQTSPGSTWPPRPYAPASRTTSNVVEDDAVSLGDSEDGSIPSSVSISMPPPQSGAPQSASSTTSFATQQAASPPPSTAGSFSSSTSSASFSSSATYRAPTPSNRVSAPSSASNVIPTGPASMRPAQIPDGPRRASFHAPKAPQPQPTTSAGKAPAQPRGDTVPSVAYTRVASTIPPPSSSTHAQPKKPPTGPASLIYRPSPSASASTGANADPPPRKLSPVAASTNPRPPSVESISNPNSNSSASSAPGRPIPVGPRSGVYNGSTQVYSQQSSDTQSQPRRGSTDPPPLSSSSPHDSANAYDREYARGDGYGPASSRAWRSPPRDIPRREWGERQQPSSSQSSQSYRRDEPVPYRMEFDDRDRGPPPQAQSYVSRGAPPTMPRAERLRREQMQREAQNQNGRGQWER
ncbi:hypothetical protein FA13DRAFT_1522619 [Coprinellus micaceus]|uniref:Uncharacterized protein n=1 Tax=Coprinellus micaceus TaxID=71717 RepID=A0A4Y7SK81_COPMI|nr:hypothetical protein FA13DRAFT_1522619 [Coprinellus micaceus]